MLPRLLLSIIMPRVAIAGLNWISWPSFSATGSSLLQEARVNVAAANINRNFFIELNLSC